MKKRQKGVEKNTLLLGSNASFCLICVNEKLLMFSFTEESCDLCGLEITKGKNSLYKLFQVFRT